ncbi:MAG: hypothetical protein COA44_14145 [Arcobacter sp.]|nr:MAG: hypothetical protein COA44_14145 [Arcobacter sp.]
MNQLKEVTFINSATLPFAQIDVGANTLFSGGNGAGKTTILRSILYFYGAGRSESLGISRKKKRFEEYYFASINSYLVYRFQNQDSDVLAIVYKAGGLRVKYRFAIERNKEEMKELFFDGNSALEPKELWSRLLEKEYELSPVMNSPKEYKSVLYGQDKKLLQFAFFSANTEYEQISKTLSNVFINSKLDSGSIKKSLVSSISGFEPIDLNHMRRNIGDFRVKYDDISSFSKNSSVIHEAVSSLGTYEEQTSELHFLAESLGANTKTGEHELSSLKEKTLVLSTELSNLDKAYEQKEKDYQVKHDEALKEQGVLERAISEARSKQAEYERLKIKDKLELWDKKPLFEEALITLKSQLSKLLDSQSSLSERFENMREREMKSFHDKEQKLKNDITQIDQDYNKANALHLKEKDERVTKHRGDSDARLQGLSVNLFKAKEEAIAASSNEKIIQNKSFDKEKIETARNEHFKAVRSFEVEQAQLQLSQSELQKVAEQVYSAEQSKDYKLQNLHLKHEKQIEDLKLSIKELIKKKDLNSGSVLGYMKENSFKNTAVLSALLKDEVLYSQELSPFLVDASSSLLGLGLDTSSLDVQAYEESAITISLQASEERLKRMNEALNIQNEELENETRNTINSLRREQGRINTLIDESLRAIPKLETQSLSLAEHLQSLQNLAAKKKDEELSRAKNEKELKERLYLSLKQEDTLLRQSLEGELDLIVKELSQRQEKLEKTKIEKLEYKNTELIKIKTQCDGQFIEIKKEEDETLVRGGVDANLLKKYQENIEAKKEELSSIEAFSELISEYKIDKKRIFEPLDTRIKELEKLTFDIRKQEEEVKLLKEVFEKEKIVLTKDRDAFLSKVNRLQKDLKEYLAFKESSLYTQLSVYIENTLLESNEDNVCEMINKLRDLGFEHASSKDKLRKKLNKAFSSMSQNNIFNLYAPGSDTDKAILASAHALKTFVLENKIETYKEQVAKEFTMTLRHLSSEISELLKAEGDISKTVSRINKTLQDLQGIKVIRGIELRYKESDNLLLNVLKAIGHLVEENPYGNEINLFSSEVNESFNEKALKNLEELSLHLSEEKSDLLTLDESFVLEFRAIENGNDTGFVASLDGIGSNGTDVMVKAMVNIAMLSLARKQSSKKEASVYFHCILDEVGILSPAYLKELIAYANNKQIRFINGAPDEKLVSTYKRLYMLSTNAKHQTIVRKLVSQS